MKKIFLLMAISALSFNFCTAQDLAPAPADKAVVYFVRMSALGFAVNFTYFDSTQVIGRFNGPKYIRYECNPGSHLFWGRSENRDFVEADLEAGKIYFIEAIPQVGGIKAQIRLQPVDPTDEKKMAKLMKFIGKKSSESFTEAELTAETKSFEEVIAKGIDKYNEEKSKGKTAARLQKSMYYTK